MAGKPQQDWGSTGDAPAKQERGSSESACPPQAMWVLFHAALVEMADDTFPVLH